MKKNTLKKDMIVVLAILAFAVLTGTQPAAAAKAPVGKTYYVISVGVATDQFEAYQLDAGCLRFTRTELCDSAGECGAWWRIQEEKRAKKQWQVGFEFDIVDDETGLPVKMNGVGRIDARGSRSSIAGAAHGVELTSGEVINFSIAGRAVSAARCEQLAADFAASQQ